MPNTHQNESSTSAMLRRINDSARFIATNKYKLGSVQLLLTFFQLIRSYFFSCKDVVNFSSINAADATMKRLNMSFLFLAFMVNALNISSRMDDGVLNEDEFEKVIIDNELLATEASVILRPRPNRAPQFDWMQIYNNEFKILMMLVFLGVDYAHSKTMDKDEDLAHIIFNLFILRMVTSLAVMIADRFDNATLTSTAYTTRHQQNIKFWNNFFPDNTESDEEDLDQENTILQRRLG